MHFIAKLFKIKYFPTFLSIWEKLSKYAFKFHKQFLYCSHYISSILHRTYWFQQYVFPIEEFQGNRMQLYWNALLLVSVKAVSYIIPLKSQTV